MLTPPDYSGEMGETHKSMVGGCIQLATEPKKVDYRSKLPMSRQD